MAKKVKFESFVYRLLAEAETIHRRLPPSQQNGFREFVELLRFRYDRGDAVVSWDASEACALAFSLNDPDLYHRGDDEKRVAEQRDGGLVFGKDKVQARNSIYFRDVLTQLCAQAGVDLTTSAAAQPDSELRRLSSEEKFHDQWASAENLAAIDVKRANEACTSPEMRYIRAMLGNCEGKKLLDVGCGLGEASVYFALEGARVTSLDLSQGMLDATANLAELNGVTVRTHKSAAERTNLSEDDLFDVIYAGNLLHHVDIEATLRLLKPHLAPGGVFVSWDPVAYNPIINVYRAIATTVRTPDEHPLKWKDIRLFRREFRDVTTKYFWLTTLSIFILMALQRRHPNDERYWKAVVNEADRWESLYRPLSKLDSALLALIPPLRLLCWNVVIVAKDPSP